MRTITSDSTVSAKYRAAARLARVRAAIRDRARRLQHLPSQMFAEPGWDILLQLYAFDLARRKVSEAEIVTRINVPGSTSVRWMKMLEAERLITRRPRDGGAEVTVALTRKAIHALEAYFNEGSSAAESNADGQTSGHRLKLVTRDGRPEHLYVSKSIQSTSG